MPMSRLGKRLDLLAGPESDGSSKHGLMFVSCIREVDVVYPGYPALVVE